MEVPDSLFFNQYFETVDSFLTSEFTSYNCILHYTPRHIACINCVFDGKGGTNVYNGTGPMSFTFGLCPVCNGKGFKDEEVTETIRFRIYGEKNNFIKGHSQTNNIEYSDGSLQIIGHLSDVPKVVKANKILVNSDEEKYRKWEYKLNSEPFKHGFGNRYFLAYLKRI